MDVRTQPDPGLQRTGGLAALYISAAYLVAIPYFVLIVDYPSVTDSASKVDLLVANTTSLQWMHVVCFELVALAVVVVTVALYRRLAPAARPLAQLGAAVGLAYAALLLASVQVYIFGMNAVVSLHATSPEQAVAAWQAIEPVAEGLGGSGGQIAGGVWVLVVSVTAHRAGALPAALIWLGGGTAVLGILSTAPGLGGLEAAFGLLQIVWFLWLGIALLRAPTAARHVTSE